MKKISTYSFLLLMVLLSCKQEAKKEAALLTMGPLTISKAQPVPGEEIDLTYRTDQELEGFYDYLVGDTYYPVDIDFSEVNGEQRSSIKIPDSAVALSFIIQVDGTYDHNDAEGYFLPLYTKDGSILPGSKAATAKYALHNGSNYGIKKDAKAAFETIKSDITAHPELQKDWNTAYFEMAYKNDKAEGKKLIDAYTTSMLKKSDLTEKEYTSILNSYSLMGEESKIDSLKTVIIKKYPNGSTAKFDIFDQFQKETDLAKKTELFTIYETTLSKLDNIGNYMAESLANQYFKNKDMEHFETYLSKIQDDSRKAATYNSLAWPMAEKGENLEQAETMSKKSLDVISALQKKPENKPDYLTKKQHIQGLDNQYRMYADTYALILFKQGKVAEAIAYQEKAQHPKLQDVDGNTRYVEFLMADQQYDKVVTKAETYLKLGHGNAKIKEAYKTAYLKVNPEAKDVNDQLTAFEKEAYNTQFAAIKKTMLDEEAPAFSLKDMEGKTVSLAEQKGKTVILDFWATWCGPCKASFPGMQDVVTKYKDDDDVVLLFVDTFEKGANREKMVEDFIKSNNYDFHVVYDPAIENSRDFEVASKYDISGIPTKVVIGPDGRMKFKSVGYSGSNEKLVNEMDIMIAILKS